MAKNTKKKKQIKKPKAKDINLPKKDIKVEEGQPTFLPTLSKILEKKTKK